MVIRRCVSRLSGQIDDCDLLRAYNGHAILFMEASFGRIIVDYSPKAHTEERLYAAIVSFSSSLTLTSTMVSS